MNVLSTIFEMRTWAQAARARNDRIVFVPTMGCLHAGHCALLREGCAHGEQLVLSIFVNPTQFGPNEDFLRYPRTLAADLEKAAACGVDVVFHPTVGEMYPQGACTAVTVAELGDQLCGAFRPGHFRGVATVVAKLFEIVTPHIALFGQKDFQQMQIIRRMVQDLHLPVEIIGCPIVREADGLAMSSRNTYLSPEERRHALSLYQGIQAAEALARQGAPTPNAIIAAARKPLEMAETRIDYVSLVDPHTLQPLDTWQTPAVLAMAAWIGKTRLIDNVIFE